MAHFSYSIIIRTLGLGGVKYQSLLNSINNLNLKPEHVYIVIPHNYSLPKEKLGYEEFIRTEKGMLHQRVFGMEFAETNCTSKYLLCLDDDVEFSSDYADKANDIISQTDCDMLMPAVLSVGQSSPKIQSRTITDIRRWTGERIESRKSKFRIAIMCNAGFKANTQLLGNVPTQSTHGTGFWIKNGQCKGLNLIDEYWVQGCKYALPEDQILGYKAYLSDLKMIHSTNIFHTHLDAGTSIDSERAYHLGFAKGRNYLIFWHRFIFLPEKNFFKKSRNITAITHRLFMTGLVAIIKGFTDKNYSNLKGYSSGIINGIRYIHSPKYKSLPRIVSKISQ